MTYNLPFDIYFHPDYDSEICVTGWENGISDGLEYYKADFDGVTVSVTGVENSDYRIKIYNGSQSCVTGFWEVRFPWKKDENCFTFIPGVYYDGNYMEDLHNIPVLHVPEKPSFCCSLSAAAFPAVMFKDKDTSHSYRISPKSIAGWNGIRLDAQNGTLGIFAPACEKNIYRFQEFDKACRPAYTLLPRSVLSIHILHEQENCDSITDLFDMYWNKTLGNSIEKSFNTPKISEAQGAELVRDWFFSRHCVYTDNGIPLILNAFTDIEGTYPYKNSMAEWNTMIGWCSGSMTALALIDFGGKYRDFAVSYLDFLSENGNSPSGIKYPVFDGKSWMTKNHPEASVRNYDHCRFYCDYIHYLGKAIRLEKQNGFAHKNWEEDFLKGINILLDIWSRENDFGLYWDIEGESVKVYRKGSGCGAFALLALAEGLRHYPENSTVLQAFSEGCELYYARCVQSGRCNGGPADIKEADDSESAAALTDALVQHCKLVKSEKSKQMAEQAAKQFSTWVVNYIPQFPLGTSFEDLNLCGGVIANTQNRHIGPGICTNSAYFLYELGKITGDSRYIAMYNNIKAAAINCITSYEGEFYGISPDSPFRKGMMSEQINLSDALGIEGETWRVSTCWPSTSVLLGNMDSPDN